VTPGTELRVVVIQSGQTPADHERAVDELIGLFEAAAGPDVDLVVFPELATTPYFCGTADDRYKAWAQTVPGPDTERFAAVAAATGTGVVFGLYERAADGRLYNSAVMIDGDGRIVVGTAADGSERLTYRKSSIPQNVVGPGQSVDEKHFFEPGTGVVTFHAFGTRFACLICYDRSFPEYWLAARAAGAEVVLTLVSSLGEREKLFTQELQVRAMETQVWVIAPNRGGRERLDDRETDYFGLSCIVAPNGDIVAQAPAHRTGPQLSATLDLGRVAAVRESFPLSRDRAGHMFAYLAGHYAPSGVAPSPGAVPVGAVS
jgi:beta-ureidopropionase